MTNLRDSVVTLILSAPATHQNWEYRDILVSPSLARTLLDTIPRDQENVKTVFERVQRNITPTHGRGLSSDMKLGRWLDNPQSNSILISSEGVLTDGQHRLKAIVDSGIARPMRVYYDVDPRTFSHIDIGKKRTASQFLSGPNAASRASAATVLMRLEALKGKIVTPANIRHTAAEKPSTDDVLQFLSSRPDIASYLQNYAPLAQRPSIRNKFLGTSGIALLAAGFVSGDAEKWWSGIEAVATGRGGLEEGNPITVLFGFPETASTGQKTIRALFIATEVRDGNKRSRMTKAALRDFKVW